MAIRGIHSSGYSAIVAVVATVGGVGYSVIVVVVALNHTFSDVLDGFVDVAVVVDADAVAVVVVAVAAAVGGVPVRT